MADPPLGAYYDGLSRWTALARFFGYGGGRETLTVHRALSDPRAGGRPTSTRIHDVLAERLPLGQNPRVLDAGCGLGGTLIALAERTGGSGVGLTLSVAQATTARKAVARRGLGARVEIEVRTYDQPPAGPFDIIVAIESLAHSPNPSATVAALARVLAPSGVLAVVDDMPNPGSGHSPDLDLFKADWACPALWTADQYREACRAHALLVETDLDLSGSVRPRTAAQVSRMETLNRIAGALPFPRWQQVMASYRGGLALERLYRKRAMTYRLLIARASGAPRNQP